MYRTTPLCLKLETNMPCYGCDPQLLGQYASWCKTGPSLSSQVAGLLGRESQRNPLRQQACDSCNQIGYKNVADILRFLENTDLRGAELATEFSRKLQSAKLFPTLGSIPECQRRKAEETQGANEILRYYDTLEGLKVQTSGPRVPTGPIRGGRPKKTTRKHRSHKLRR